MSWNNITPAWMLGKFNDYFKEYEKGNLTTVEFFELIRTLEEVPPAVKNSWKDKCERGNI